MTVSLHTGSSPRMRETPERARPARARARLIPAYAGNTRSLTSQGCVWPAHPRACGEHSGFSSASRTALGSSPRMRGTLHRSLPLPLLHRLIPARAGNTRAQSSTHSPAPVHPRACGEHKDTEEPTGEISGSSPRMRGTRWLPGQRHLPARFISAHAGNPITQRHIEQHPAGSSPACGEHAFFHTQFSNACGSSPRMRGTRDQIHRELDRPGSSPHMRGTRYSIGYRHHSPRFVPVHAGNTTPKSPTPTAGSGSSPRMRGTRDAAQRGPDPWRFIPAHAGNTRCAPFPPSCRTVHPRACGEHIPGGAGTSQMAGSSPRMRGTRYWGTRRSRRRRFIPAHAGNTTAELDRLKEVFGSSPRMRGTLFANYADMEWCRFIPAHAGNTRSLGRC